MEEAASNVEAVVAKVEAKVVAKVAALEQEAGAETTDQATYTKKGLRGLVVTCLVVLGMTLGVQQLLPDSTVSLRELERQADEVAADRWEQWKRALGPEQSALELQAYQELRSQCKWREVETKGYLNLYNSSFSYNVCRPSNYNFTTAKGRQPPAGRPHSYKMPNLGRTFCLDAPAHLRRQEANTLRAVQECAVDVPPEDAGSDRLKWVVQRVGPFRSVTADAWVQFGFHLEGALRAWPDRPLHVAGHFLAPVRADTGQPLANPPVHIHHAHVTLGGVRFTDGINLNASFTRATSNPAHWAWAAAETGGGREVKRPEWKLFVQAHGDSQCGPAGGGMGCLMERFPSGFVTVADDLMGADADLNVDPSLVGALPDFYFELALLIRQPPAAPDRRPPVPTWKGDFEQRNECVCERCQQNSHMRFVEGAMLSFHANIVKLHTTRDKERVALGAAQGAPPPPPPPPRHPKISVSTHRPSLAARRALSSGHSDRDREEPEEARDRKKPDAGGRAAPGSSAELRERRERSERRRRAESTSTSDAMSDASSVASSAAGEGGGSVPSRSPGGGGGRPPRNGRRALSAAASASRRSPSTAAARGGPPREASSVGGGGGGAGGGRAPDEEAGEGPPQRSSAAKQRPRPESTCKTSLRTLSGAAVPVPKSYGTHRRPDLRPSFEAAAGEPAEKPEINFTTDMIWKGVAPVMQKYYQGIAHSITQPQPKALPPPEAAPGPEAAPSQGSTPGTAAGARDGSGAKPATSTQNRLKQVRACYGGPPSRAAVR